MHQTLSGTCGFRLYLMWKKTSHSHTLAYDLHIRYGAKMHSSISTVARCRHAFARFVNVASNINKYRAYFGNYCVKRAIRCCLSGDSTIQWNCNWKPSHERDDVHECKEMRSIRSQFHADESPPLDARSASVCVCVSAKRWVGSARMPNSDCCQIMLAVLFCWMCLRIHVRVPSHERFVLLATHAYRRQLSTEASTIQNERTIFSLAMGGAKPTEHRETYCSLSLYLTIVLHWDTHTHTHTHDSFVFEATESWEK